MNIGVISTRYAKALLDYSVTLGDEETTYRNMLQLMGVLQSVKELSVMLRSPHLSPKERISIICSAVEPSGAFKKFAALVVRQGREDMLLFIAHAYVMLYRKKKGIFAAKFVTASPVSDDFRREITGMIEKRMKSEVELECVSDSSLIGGFIIEANSKRLDASVKGEIGKIRKALVKQNRKLV